MAKDILEIVRYFRESNPTLQIIGSTNAGIRPAGFWEELARLRMIVFFCIDGLKNTHSLYRVDTDYDTVIQNATTFIDAGGDSIWMMTKFDHNSDQINEAKKIAKSLKFNKFELRDIGRDTGPAYSRSGQPMHFIGKPNGLEKLTVEETMRITKEHVASYKYTNYNDATPATTFNCEVTNHKSIYIDALGDAYPCCYIGHYPKTLETDRFIGAEQLAKLVDGIENNAITHGIEHAISWFNKVSERFNVPTFEEGRLYRCHDCCGTK